MGPFTPLYEDERHSKETPCLRPLTQRQHGEHRPAPDPSRDCFHHAARTQSLSGHENEKEGGKIPKGKKEKFSQSQKEINATSSTDLNNRQTLCFHVC